jgi:hypothetical protein
VSFWEWVRVANAVLFLVVCVLFGVVNWDRRHDTDRWDAMARIGSWALFLCLGYATTDAIWNDVPTGPRQGPICACLVLVSVAYVMLLRRAVRERRADRDDQEDYRNGWPPSA